MTQEPRVVYPPPLDQPLPLLPAPADADTGPGRVSPQSVLLGAGAVAVVAAGASSLDLDGALGRGLVAVLAVAAAATSLAAGRRELRSTEEVLAGCAAVLAVIAARTAEGGWHPLVLAGLVGLLFGLRWAGPSAAAWPVASWATAQLAVLAALGGLAGGTAPHAAAVVGTALTGLLVARVARRPVALVALASTAPWWVVGVLEGLGVVWAAGTPAAPRAGTTALVVAAAAGLVAIRSRRMLRPVLGPRPLVPVLAGLVAGAAAAGALSATGSAGVPLTGYLGLGLAALVAQRASTARESVLRPAGLTTASTMTVLAVGQLLGAGRWPDLSLLLAVAALPALLVAARQPVDRPGALPVAVGCLSGSVLLADAGGVLPPATAGVLLLVLAVGSLVAATLLRDQRPELPLAVTGAVVGLVALVVPGDWSAAAPQLAVLGVALTGYGTVAGRDGGRGAGCAALVGAAWLTAADTGTDLPEAWTLPVAGALLLYAGRGLASAPSWSSWGPGLVTGFAPSVFLAVVQPDVTRVVLVVAVATLTTTLGARWELQAPLVVGAGSLVTVAVGRLVDVLPWSGLAAVAVAGALLLAVGARYEDRRQQALGALARVADMR